MEQPRPEDIRQRKRTVMTFQSSTRKNYSQLSFNLLMSFSSILGAISIGFFVVTQNFNLLGLILLLPIATLAIAKPNFAVSLFYISVFIPSSYIQRYFFSLPTILLWLPHMSLLLALISVLIAKQKRAPVTKPWPISFLLVGLAWLLIVFLSLIVNANTSNPIAAILSLRCPFLIYGSILLHRLQFSAKDYQEHLIKNMVWVGLAMLPISVFQRIYFVEYLVLGSGDMVTGLFMSYAGLVFFQLFCIMAVTSWWLNGRRLLPIHPALNIVLLFIPLVISNSKAAPIYFLLVATFLIWQNRRRLSGRLFGTLLFLTIMGIIGTIAFDNVYQVSYGVSDSVIERWYTPEGVLSYLLSNKGSSTGGLQRGAAIVFNYELIKRENLTLLLGLGPGALSDSRVPGGTGHIYSMYPLLLLNNNSIATLLGELGLAGIGISIVISASFYFLYSSDETSELVSLRKGTALLFAAMLIYGTILLFPEFALVTGLLCIQSI
jgi:hypothetical protein